HAPAEALRASLSIPVIGIEPGIKPAVSATRSGVVGAIVPAAVSESDRLASLLDRFGGDVKVIIQPVPGVVEHIEQADLDGPELRRLVEGYVRPMLDAGADAIVLGSTHYVFLKPLLREIAGPKVVLVETGAAGACHPAGVRGGGGRRAAGEKGGKNFGKGGDRPGPQRVFPVFL